MKRLTLLVLISLFLQAQIRAQDVGVSRSNEEDFLSSLPTKARISDEEWKEIAGDATEQLYIVQEGDTLWDICQQFFDSPFYWPKLWSVNQEQLTNPHNLEVGTEIRFMIGSGTQLPGISVREDGPDFLDQSIDLLPDQRERESEYDDLGFKKGLVLEKNIPDRYQVEGIIVRDKIPNYGEIVGSFQARTYFTTTDIIYVDLQESGKVQEGTTYSVFKYEGKVRDPDSLLGFSLGRWVEVLGDIKIISIKDGRARALVTNAYGPITRGNFLTDYLPAKDKISRNYVSELIKADIVLLSLPNRTFEQSGGQVYINRGRSDGLKIGTILNVIATKDGVTDTSEFVQPEVKGQLMIIHTEENSATCIALQSAQEFYIGDLVVTAPKPVASN